MKVGDFVRIVDIEEVTNLIGGCLYYDKEDGDYLVYDKRFDKKLPFGKKLVIVKIEEKMSPRSIAVCAQNKKKDWKYWWWIPERYIKEIIK